VGKSFVQESVKVPLGALEALRQFRASVDLDGLARRCVMVGRHASHCAEKAGAIDLTQFDA
jgi:hypothetical protein